LVIVRSDLFHEGSHDKTFDYSCQIVVDPSISGNELLEAVVKSAPLEHPKSMSEVLNPVDRLNKETAVARISREVFMGQAMFVVDIAVMSARIKIVPFFLSIGNTDPHR